MELFDNSVCFLATAPPEAVAKEKEKARALRKTQWWQRQISRGICFYCRKPTRPEDLTMDHIVPLVRQGRTTRGNVVPACKDCNNRKKYMLPIEWEGYLANASAPASLQDGPADNHSEEPPHGTV